MTVATCGTCDHGCVPVDYCTCQPENGHHRGACGRVPCPNGCWERLYGIRRRPSDGPSLLASLAQDDGDVLVADRLIHSPAGDDCPNDASHRMARKHAIEVLHLHRCSTCFPQGRAA